MRLDRLVVSVVLATVVFVAYSRTLLPGVDLGDTAAFQAAVLWPRTSARQAYPLYYALARPFVVAVAPETPARGLNLFSAVAGAAAVGLLTWVASAAAGSLLAGAAAGLLLGFSYTFWTQAVIAEVYTLHLALLALCCCALYAYGRHPSLFRLGIFCVVYAAGFGNHLAMILLLVPFAAFIALAHPRPLELFAPRVIGIAVLAALAGALQYAPNLLATWSSIEAPAGAGAKLAAFWFDTTKADWRESMVLGVDSSRLGTQLAMWAWDARQQFGVVGLVAAAAGAVRLWWIARPWAVLVWLGYAISVTFAATYNVGDAHVFFLPAHFFTALAAAFSMAPAAPREHAAARWRTTAWRRLAPVLGTATLVAYGGWRAWETWPAADRRLDRRGDELVAHLLRGVDEQRALLVSHLPWDIENAVLYTTRYERPEVAWARLPEVMPHLPFLVRDNRTIGRDIVLTADAAGAIAAAFGTSIPLATDSSATALSLAEHADRIPRGTPYILTRLTPVADRPDVAEDLARALRVLTGESPPRLGAAAYEVIAGVAGERPSLVHTAERPFHLSSHLLGDELTIRMDAWIPGDTFRRGGFGHVLRGRERVLFVERGVSLAWLPPTGPPLTAYAAGPYERQPRFVIPGEIAGFAYRR